MPRHTIPLLFCFLLLGCVLMGAVAQQRRVGSGVLARGRSGVLTIASLTEMFVFLFCSKLVFMQHALNFAYPSCTTRNAYTQPHSRHQHASQKGHKKTSRQEASCKEACCQEGS